MDRTRIVKALRVVLPLLALALLSTMFLISREPEAVSRIPYAEVEAEAMARDPRVVAPQFAGVTEDGTVLSLTAQSASVDGMGGTGGSAAEALRMEWTRPDGLVAEITAPTAGLAEGRVRLEGGVLVTTSTGWRVETPRVEAATNRAELLAEDGIAADGPLGRLDAGAMRIAPADPDVPDGPAVLDFTGSVRLIYEP